jgi:hypothetical protein
MLSTKLISKRPSKTSLALFALFSAVLAFSSSSLQAADAPASQAAATASTAEAPLSATFEKTSSEKTPYVLHLKNTSDKEVTASGRILLASAFHSEAKAKAIKEHKVGAGKTWTIKNLSADDKVQINAEGFAPLQLTVK